MVSGGLHAARETTEFPQAGSRNRATFPITTPTVRRQPSRNPTLFVGRDRLLLRNVSERVFDVAAGALFCIWLSAYRLQLLQSLKVLLRVTSSAVATVNHLSAGFALGACSLGDSPRLPLSHVEADSRLCSPSPSMAGVHSATSA